MLQKFIIVFIFLFWVSPVWSGLPEGAPSSISIILHRFYVEGIFFPLKDLNRAEEGGIFFALKTRYGFKESVTGTSYNDKNKNLEMLDKRWVRHALDKYYSIRDEEEANKKYNKNVTMAAKLAGLPRKLHISGMCFGDWEDLFKSQEVLALPSSCYIAVIDLEQHIKNEEEAKSFLNQLLPHLVARNLCHLEVVWNSLYNGVSHEADPAGDCSFVLSGKALTEAYIESRKKGLTYPSNFAEKLEELYGPVQAANKEYEKLQGTLNAFDQEIKEKKEKIRAYLASSDYFGIMCQGLPRATPKQQEEYALLLKNQTELQLLEEAQERRSFDLYKKEAVVADLEEKLGKEFVEKVKDMTFSSHISHQDHETQVCEDDFKPEKNPPSTILGQSNPSLKCPIIEKEIRNKSALIQQLESLIKQQETILEQQKKELENLTNGSCSYLVAADKEPEEISPDDSPPTTTSSKQLSPNNSPNDI